MQAFNIFNHTQFGDPSTDNLALNYVPVTNAAGNVTWTLQPVSVLGLITSTNNFNNNNDNAASPNTGTGLPRQDAVHAQAPVLTSARTGAVLKSSGEFQAPAFRLRQCWYRERNFPAVPMRTGRCRGSRISHLKVIQRGLALYSLVLACSCLFWASFGSDGYELTRKIAIPGQGSWDYLSSRRCGRRLYVSHGVQVDVLDVDSGEILGKHTQPSVFMESPLLPNLAGVSSVTGKSSTVTIFDLKTL